MSTPTPRPSYAAVLRVPHARRTIAAALLGRLSYGTVSLALLLSLTRSTGSYAVAGLVMALFGATSVFLSPYRAALVDRRGPRRALLPMALLYAALLCVLAAACWRPGTPAGVLAVTAAIAGACTPPLGPTMRAVWAEPLPDRAMLQRAYSLDGVAVACAGLFVAPALTTAYLIADESAASGFRTRAGAWCNTAVNAGMSAGAAAVGLLVERLPLPACFAVSGAVAVAAALVPGRRSRGAAGRPGEVSRRPSRSRRRRRSPSGASGRR
ncbi:hypothetical protein NGM36_16970 [Streptomyces mutabilis]|uniref:MFS transporter n=1 Tax=Streptomyces mutabilis TaxID=67332 RepID=UPI0022BA2AAA|nr:MFS transporter [Streptomyces mutabilis]MCZ9351461.1 hypothetical protein [Streptomyces mutabilis]